MNEDIDQICERENAMAADLDRAVAAKQRVSRIIYQYDRQILDKTIDILIDMADGSRLQLSSTEEQKQRLISQLRDYADIIRERIKAYEESHNQRR